MNTRAIAALCSVIVSTLAAAPAGAQLLPGERPANVTAIPGVVAAGAKWQLFWADFATADGMVGTPDGGVMFAQEQTDSVRKLDPDGTEHIVIAETRGVGSVSMDAQGRIFGVERTCTEPLNTFLPGCEELTMVTQLYPERKVLANSFPDGKTLGRPNDLITDGKGGAYFTSGGLYYVTAAGAVSTVEDQNLRSNGLMLSPDGRTLYVTNNTEVLAFDVHKDGSAGNRRVFGGLAGDNGGDGMTVDSAGRLYVTAAAGVHVLSPSGQHLGLIPSPRRPITLAFSGPDKKTLFVGQMGAVGPDGKAWKTPKGIRNIAMTIYKIEMLAQGYKGRPK